MWTWIGDFSSKSAAIDAAREAPPGGVTFAELE
jgi:hypothetical protein